MKHKIHLLNLFLLLGFITILSSCDNPDSDTETSLSLNFYPKAGNSDLVYNQIYIVNGRKLKFTRAQFYVSGIRLKKAGNSFVSPEMQYALVHAAAIENKVGTIEPGNYTGLEFSVGVDSAANHGNPAQWNSDHPLFTNSLYSTYWTWSAGYVFTRIEGYVDTSAAANAADTDLAGFAYHIGNDEMLRNVSLSINKNIEGEQAAIDLNVDYAKMLENVDFKTEIQTHATGFDPLSEKIADKAAEAITIP